MNKESIEFDLPMEVEELVLQDPTFSRNSSLVKGMDI
jgi:hypothetical protein